MDLERLHYQYVTLILSYDRVGREESKAKIDAFMGEVKLAMLAEVGMEAGPHADLAYELATTMASESLHGSRPTLEWLTLVRSHMKRLGRVVAATADFYRGRT